LAVLEDIDSIYTSGYATIEQDVIRGVFALAEQEAGFSTKLYNIATEANFVLPSESSLMQAVELAPMAVPKDVGLTIDAALTEYGDKKIEQIKQAITDGVVLGDTTPEISAKVGNIMTTLHRRQLETLVRTTTNHTSSVARQETFKQNEDILEGYRWIATLDNRTTLICMSRDQQKLRIGIDPMPPAHWGCRSTTIPIVKDEYNLGSGITGQRASKGAKGGETVSANLSYGGWLKTQPSAFVDEALGVERSRLFRSGKLTIDKFVDPTGRVFTIQELENQNPFIFME
jgi:SPP1 gp7 family putative phage head morphogenesis protein